MDLTNILHLTNLFIFDKDRFYYGDLTNREQTEFSKPKVTMHISNPKDNILHLITKQNLEYMYSQDLSNEEHDIVSQYLNVVTDVGFCKQINLLPFNEKLFAKYTSAIGKLRNPIIKQADLSFRDDIIRSMKSKKILINGKRKIENSIERAKFAMKILPIVELDFKVQPYGDFIFSTRESLDKNSGQTTTTYIVDRFVKEKMIKQGKEIIISNQKRVIVSGYKED